jgi:hypothetical protein
MFKVIEAGAGAAWPGTGDVVFHIIRKFTSPLHAMFGAAAVKPAADEVRCADGLLTLDGGGLRHAFG